MPDTSILKSNSPPSPTEPENEAPVYRGQPIRGHSRRRSPLIKSFVKGLKGNPLAAITKLMPKDYTQGVGGRLTPEMFVDKLIHHNFSVSSMTPLF